VFLSDVTPDDLRQGDVVYAGHMPYWNLNTAQMIQKSQSRPAAMIVALRQDPPLPILVVSGDCELENPRSRMGVLVAPIMKWPNQVRDADSSARLWESIRRQGEPPNATYSYANFWPLKVPETDLGAQEPQWMVADFSGMSTVSPAAKAIALFRERRRFEMDEEHRRLLQYKLAAYFLR